MYRGWRSRPPAALVPAIRVGADISGTPQAVAKRVSRLRRTDIVAKPGAEQRWRADAVLKLERVDVVERGEHMCLGFRPLAEVVLDLFARVGTTESERIANAGQEWDIGGHGCNLGPTCRGGKRQRARGRSTRRDRRR